MIFALNRSVLMTLIVSLVVALIACLVFLDGAAPPAEIWGRRGLVLIAVNGIILALCIPQVFAVFHKLTLAGYWLFPLLDGEWDAEIRSNWPRIRRTYEAARTKSAKFDAMADPLDRADEAESITRAKVTIRSSLVHIAFKLEPEGSARIGRSRFVRAFWRKPDLPELEYVYEQTDPDTLARTDTRRHFGAALVCYDPDTDVISGDYWTNRSAEFGLNSAGTIRMTRRPADPPAAA